jgi:transcriptional regulator GlxA family with amidase domain
VCAGLNLIAQHPTRLKAFLRLRHQEGCNIGAISMGSIFLARAGLLDDRRCTIHWEGEPAFREEFPELNVTRAIYEIDERIFTCAGGMSSFDLALALIARDHSDTVLRAIANQLQLDRIRTEVALQSAGTEHIPATAPKMLTKAISLLHANMENPISLQSLSDEVGASRRTLERLFLKFTGMTPSKYCKTQRLERSRDLLTHSNLTITDISLATGFRSASYFSSCFSKHFGTPPTTLRQGHGP